MVGGGGGVWMGGGVVHNIRRYTETTGDDTNYICKRTRTSRIKKMKLDNAKAASIKGKSPSNAPLP